MGAAVIALLTIAFLRLDPAALRGHLRRPWLALLAIAWTAIAIPGVIGAAASLPVYFSPALMQPLMARLRRPSRGA